jgi:hypothetical protein
VTRGEIPIDAAAIFRVLDLDTVACRDIVALTEP